MDLNCVECGGSEFDECNGKRYCLECQTEVVGSYQLMSEEINTEISSNRFIKIRDKDSHDEQPEVIETSNWITFECYNKIFHKWTAALCDLGASERFHKVAFLVWVSYLKKAEVGFFIEPSPANSEDGYTSDSSAKLDLSTNKRNLEILHKNKGVLSESQRKKRKKPKKGLDKIIGDKHKRRGYSTNTLIKRMGKVLDYEKGLTTDDDSEVESNYLSDCSATTFGCETDDADATPAKRQKRNEKWTKINFREEEEDFPLEFNEYYEDWNNYRDILSKKQKKQLKETSEISSDSGINIKRSLLRSYKILSPIHLTFAKLLALLYLAILLSEEEIMLQDLLRWCHEDYIPFYSLYYLVPELKILKCDLGFFKGFAIPNAKKLTTMTGRMATFISVPKIPLLPSGYVLEKFIQFLNLPVSFIEKVQPILQFVISKRRVSEFPFCFPVLELETAVALIISFKIYFGINDRYEYLLSNSAHRINHLLKKAKSDIELFQWTKWKSYMDNVLNFNQHFDMDISNNACYMKDGDRLFNQFWSQSVWTCVKPVRSSRNGPYFNTLIELQGVDLEKELNKKRLFKASKDPILGKVLQYNKSIKDEGKNKSELLKIASTLRSTSFKDQRIDFTQDLEFLEKEFEERNIKVKLERHICVRNNILPSSDDLPHSNNYSKYCCKIFPTSDLIPLDNIDKILIPQPHMVYWTPSNPDIQIGNKVIIEKNMSYTWLVDLMVKICYVERTSILTMVKSCELKSKKVS